MSRKFAHIRRKKGIQYEVDLMGPICKSPAAQP